MSQTWRAESTACGRAKGAGRGRAKGAGRLRRGRTESAGRGRGRATKGGRTGGAKATPTEASAPEGHGFGQQPLLSVRWTARLSFPMIPSSFHLVFPRF